MTETQPSNASAYSMGESQRAAVEKDYHGFLKESEDRLRYQIEFAQAALRNLLLVNGGAILAMLTALGNSAMDHDSRGMFWSFVWFGVGLSAALLAYFCAFYSQLYFYNAATYQTWNSQAQAHKLDARYDHSADFTRGNLALVIGAILASLSLVTFVVGAFVALKALIG